MTLMQPIESTPAQMVRVAAATELLERAFRTPVVDRVPVLHPTDAIDLAAE